MTSQILAANDVLAEIMNGIQFPCPQERKVPKSELIAYSRWMGEVKGYQPSEQSLFALLDYLKGYGLFLMGDVGTGKTMFFRCLKSDIKIFSLLRLMAKPLNDITQLLEDLQFDEVVIDDIGAEPVYNNYGSRLDLLPWVVEQRYESNMRTHFTTNLSAEELKNRYGVRVLDRLKELSQPHFFSGKSRRKAMVLHNMA